MDIPIITFPQSAARSVLKELNKKYENIDDSKKRRQARDYANAMYHPKVIYKIP